MSDSVKLVVCGLMAMNAFLLVWFALDGSPWPAAINAGALVFAYLLNFCEVKP